MNILLLCPSDPLDTSSGGAQRTQFLHRALARLGDVYTLIPVPLKCFEMEDLQRKVVHRCVERRFSLPWLANRFISQRLPLIKIPSLTSPRVCHCWHGIQFDCVAVRYTHWAAYFRAWEVAPLFLDIDDLPLECHQTMYTRRDGGAIRRIYDTLLMRIMAQWSQFVFKKCEGVWLANPNHVSTVVHNNALWLPNLPREPRCEPSNADEQKNFILSVGYMGYFANHQGVGRFVNNVWPVIRKENPNLEYWIVGKDLPESVRQEWSKIDGLRVLGFVEDIESLYRESIFSVAPIYSGSGTCIKVLESLRMGRVCLASRFAVRGMAQLIKENNGILVGDSDDELLMKARWLLSHCEERQRLQSEAIRSVVEAWNFELFAEHVRLVLDKGSSTLFR